MGFVTGSRGGPIWIRLLLILVVLAAIGYRRGLFHDFLGGSDPTASPSSGDGAAAELAPSDGASEIEHLFQGQISGSVVEIRGRVQRKLSDDTEGSPHQRFILLLSSGRTLLVAHNLDLAQRVPLEVGDEVSLRGQYEWNDQGGVLHWTHSDPDGQRPGGWILHKGTRYR